ncbi:hypothetical protein HOL46_02765, partial [Candidatus Falkowbacteria bacterium]|nr:hypothetical protein [Candidatus Falkowbacteria bacterium]
RKKYFDEIGGFDESNLTEDIEITWNFLANNYLVKMCVPSKVYSIAPSKLGVWFKQRLRWNMGGIQTMFKYRKTFFRKLSTDTRSCLNLDSRNGGIGSIARLNDMLCQNGVNCRIVPSKQLIRVARSFEIKSIEVFGQKIRSIYLPEGLADEFVGGRVFGANFRHSFDHECNGVKNILGGHWDPGGHLERLGILKVDSIKQGINGCYRANAKLLNRSYHPEKSYFGKDWTAEQISQALCESFENITKAKKSYDGRWRLIGKAKNGLKVEMIVLPQNGGWFVETFYPLIN